jgi:hypothetical protein
MAVMEGKLNVLVPERESREALAGNAALKLIVHLEPARIRSIRNLFVEVSATSLPKVAEAVKVANESKYLRVLFVRADVDAMLLPQMLGRAALRGVSKVLVHASDDWQTPKRVMNAWKMGAEDCLIATASANAKTLHIVNCALESFEIDFDKIPALKGVDHQERKNFKIEPYGSYIYWSVGDVHLDIESLRYLKDSDFRKDKDNEKLLHDKAFGSAVSKIRKLAGLKQSEIVGVSERQLRRIESEGVRPTIATLKALAQSHKLGVDEYLEQIARNMTA